MNIKLNFITICVCLISIGQLHASEVGLSRLAVPLNINTDYLENKYSAVRNPSSLTGQGNGHNIVDKIQQRKLQVYSECHPEKGSALLGSYNQQTSCENAKRIMEQLYENRSSAIFYGIELNR
ncbi:MAG: hypothetical protein HOJ35_08905 [Bdellovibrionales bacterium]|jgi:hypothetical protein|nr:hypothetical protein [Bdellovibrionales bacterium]